MGKKRRYLSKASLNNTQNILTLSHEERISYLTKKSELSRDERQLLAKSYAAVDKTESSLFALLPLRGKVSTELDEQINQALSTVCHRLEQDPRLLYTLNAVDLVKLAAALRNKKDASSLFQKALSQLVFSALRHIDTPDRSATLDFLTAISSELGLLGFSTLAKSRTQDYLLHQKGDAPNVCHQLLSAGLSFFVAQKTFYKEDFQNFARLTIDLFFSDKDEESGRHKKAVFSELQKSIEFWEKLIEHQQSQIAFFLPEILLTPSYFHILPDSSRLKQSFVLFLDGITKDILKDKSLYDPDYFKLTQLAFGLMPAKNSSLLQNWLAKDSTKTLPDSLDPSPIPLSLLCQATLRAFRSDVTKKLSWHQSKLGVSRFFAELTVCNPSEAIEMLENSVASSELTLEELSLWKEIADPKIWTSTATKSAMNKLQHVMQTTRMTKEEQENWLFWLCDIKKLEAQDLQMVKDCLQTIHNSELIWQAIEQQRYAIAFKNLFSGKCDESEIKTFFSALLFVFLHTDRLNQLDLSIVEKFKFYSEIFKFLESFGRKRNLLKNYPYLSILKTKHWCPCPECLRDFLTKCSNEWSKHGIEPLPKFLRKSSQNLNSQADNVVQNPLNAGAFVNWQKTPLHFFQLKANYSKAEVLKKTMEILALRRVDMKDIRIAQALLLKQENAAFWKFFWSTDAKQLPVNSLPENSLSQLTTTQRLSRDCNEQTI